MTLEEMLHFVTWHFEVGSALDTRVKILGGGHVAWEGRLSGPYFDVTARIETRIEGRAVVATAWMKAAPVSRLFDMVLGCRLMSPPSRLYRVPLSVVDHAGMGSYYNLPKGGCVIAWGEHGSHYDAQCERIETPKGFGWCPYIADEPDCWRLHARIRATGGVGFRRFWVFDREAFHLRIGEGRQNVTTEKNANSPFYRIFRTADYRERIARESLVYTTRIRVALPEGLLP